MKRSEKIIQRLKNMGVLREGFPIRVYAHRGSSAKAYGEFCWVIIQGNTEIGSTDSMLTCLLWKKWIYSPNLGQIFEYIKGVTFEKYGDIIENS